MCDARIHHQPRPLLQLRNTYCDEEDERGGPISREMIEIELHPNNVFREEGSY
jgi:hypothetical protein